MGDRLVLSFAHSLRRTVSYSLRNRWSWIRTGCDRGSRGRECSRKIQEYDLGDVQHYESDDKKINAKGNFSSRHIRSATVPVSMYAWRHAWTMLQRASCVGYLTIALKNHRKIVLDQNNSAVIEIEPLYRVPYIIARPFHDLGAFWPLLYIANEAIFAY